MKRLLLIIGMAVVTACATRIYPVTSPYYMVPVGSTVTVNRTLTIEPDLARVRFQYGKLISEKEKNKYYANCSILVREVKETAQTIQPGNFTVVRSRKTEEYVKRDSRLVYASMLYRTDLDEDSGPMAAEYTTILDLQSQQQPQVMRLECTYWEDPYDAKHLTLAEMQKTLGDWVTITVKEQK